MQKIIFTSHCLLNTAAKVVLYNEDEIAAEEALRRRFLKKALEQGVQIIQFPCPEFTLYGANRFSVHIVEIYWLPICSRCMNIWHIRIAFKYWELWESMEAQVVVWIILPMEIGMAVSVQEKIWIKHCKA